MKYIVSLVLVAAVCFLPPAAVARRKPLMTPHEINADELPDGPKAPQPVPAKPKPELKFPCDLSKAKALPKIYLLGDAHHTDKEKDIQFESFLGASRGKCYVASEGYFCNETDPYAKPFKFTPKETPGIEDPFTNGLAGLLSGFSTNVSSGKIRSSLSNF